MYTHFEVFSKEEKKACCHLMSSAKLPVSSSTSLPDKLHVMHRYRHYITHLHVHVGLIEHKHVDVHAHHMHVCTHNYMAI